MVGWWGSRFCDAQTRLSHQPDAVVLDAIEAVKLLCAFAHAAVYLGGHRPTHHVAAIDFSFFLSPADKGDNQPGRLQGRLVPRLPGNPLTTTPNLYTIPLIDISTYASLFRSGKLDIFGRRDERIIDTSSLFISVQKQHSVRGLLTSKDGGCGFTSTYNEMGVFHGGFASSTASFCIGDSRRSSCGFAFSYFSIPHIGVWACYFFSPHHGSGDFQPSHDKKVLTVHGSTSSAKKRRIDI